MPRKCHFVMLEPGGRETMPLVNRRRPKRPGHATPRTDEFCLGNASAVRSPGVRCRTKAACQLQEHPRMINFSDKQCFADYIGRITSSPRPGKGSAFCEPLITKKNISTPRPRRPNAEVGSRRSGVACVITASIAARNRKACIQV